MRVGTVVGVVVGALLFCATAELGVRSLRPAPRVQVIDPANPALVHVAVDGVPLWHLPIHEGWLRPQGCAPGDDRRVVVAGDSVLFSGDAAPRLAELLAEALREEPGGVCVLDGSSGAYFPYQQAAVVRQAHARAPIDLAVVSVWKPDRRYQPFGPVWADAEAVERVGDLPRPVVPVPAAAHRALVERSAAWRYLTLATATLLRDPVRPEGTAYEALVDWARGAGVRLLLLEVPPLDRPFADTVAARIGAPPRGRWSWHKALAARAAEAGFGYVVLAEALQGEDHERIRLDACCHYNGAGHRALAGVVAPAARELLSARGPTR